MNKLDKIYTIICPKCRGKREMIYRAYWAVKKGLRSRKCFDCSRLKKGMTNSGSFKRGEHRSESTEFKIINGLTPLFNKIRNNPKYNQWRVDIFKRDKYNCQKCGKYGGELSVDHIKTFSSIIKENNIKSLKEALNCKELWEMQNGITVCWNSICHPNGIFKKN